MISATSGSNESQGGSCFPLRAHHGPETSLWNVDLSNIWMDKIKKLSQLKQVKLKKAHAKIYWVVNFTKYMLQRSFIVHYHIQLASYFNFLFVYFIFVTQWSVDEFICAL